MPLASLITNKSNILYLSGFSGSHGFMLITKNKKILFTDSRYIEEARNKISKSIEVRNVTKLWKNPKELKREWLATLKKLRIKTLGFEGGSLTVNQFKKYKKMSPKIKFKDITGEIERLREKKTKNEISLIKKSQKITEKTFTLIKKIIQKNKSKKLREIDVVWEIKRLGFTLGAEDVSFEPIVAFGENSSVPHHKSDNTILKKDDLVLIDMGMKYKNYCSDMTRVIFLAKPTPLQKKVFSIVLAAQKNAINKVRIGMLEQKIDSLSRKTIESHGYGENFGHGTGHGVGLDIHESPNLSPLGKQKIKKGMVMTIEPGIYLPGKFGIRLENMILVTEKGAENLTNIKI